MRMLNCMWSAEPDYRSIHKVMYSFAEALQPTKITHCFLMGELPGDFILKDSFSLHSSKKHTKKKIARFLLRRRYSKIIKEQNPEIVIVDGMGMARLLLPLLTQYAELRVLVFIHGPTRITKRDKKIFELFSVERLRCVAVSKFLEKQLRNKLSNTSIYAIPTFLKLPKYDVVSCGEDEASSLTFGAVGRLVYEKNFTLLINLIRELKKPYNIILKIAGEGEQREFLQSEINNYDLQENIKLLGHIDNMSNYYNEIDVLLVPSFKEGQGLVIQEALHYNKPVICSDLEVFEEQLGSAGVYCAANDVGQWVTACEKFISTQQLNTLLTQQKQYSEQYNSASLYRERCIEVCQLPWT